MPFTADQQRTLNALIDCIIPADDFPSASQNGVAVYIDRLLHSDLQHREDEVRLGLAALNDEAIARRGRAFADLDEPARIELLRLIEEGEHVLAMWTMPASRFFELMVTLTNEGYYADRSNGSNTTAASWTMIGYDPRVPETRVTEKWLEGLT
jgi:Gluconate 2-dehydrogenase subunit 3